MHQHTHTHTLTETGVLYDIPCVYVRVCVPVKQSNLVSIKTLTCHIFSWLQTNTRPMALAAYLQCCTGSSRFATPQQATTARTSTVRLMLLIALQNQQLATYIQAASRCNHPVAAHSLASCNYAVSSTFVYMCVLAYVCVMSMCVCVNFDESGAQCGGN